MKEEQREAEESAIDDIILCYLREQWRFCEKIWIRKIWSHFWVEFQSSLTIDIWALLTRPIFYWAELIEISYKPTTEVRRNKYWEEIEAQFKIN